MNEVKRDAKECEKVAELIGAILGDGNIYDRKSFYVELCGNPKTDAIYFKKVLLPIVRRKLSRNPKVFLRSGGLRFRIHSKAFVLWLKAIGVPAGEFRARTQIPAFIVGNEKILRNCIRGVFDTDGSVYFDKRPAYKRPYPRIELHMNNVSLLNQVVICLNSLGIRCSLIKSKSAIETAGFESLELFLKEIGFSNDRHISRIKKYYPNLAKLNRAPVAQLAEQVEQPA